MSARIALADELAPQVQKAYELLAPESRSAAITYRASIDSVVPDAAGWQIRRLWKWRC